MAGLSKEDVCVVIPAYNEEKNIGRVLSRLRELGYTAVVCDDGSRDQTAAIARSSGAHVLTSPKNEGKGASIRRGFQWFLGRNFKAAVLMDADGQHEPAEINRFLEALSGAPFIIGDRMRSPENMPFVRRATNGFMSWILSRCSGQTILDSQCGYRALCREVIENISLKTSRFEIESEMILQAAKRGFTIGSLPVRSVYRGGSSHIQPIRDTFRFIYFLFQSAFLK